MKVLFEYSSAVIEIEDARSGGSAQDLDIANNKLQNSVGDKCEYHRKEEGGREIDSEDAESDFRVEDEDFENADENESGGDDDDDDDDDDDGGFFLSNEDEKDDPMEHALQALLDIETENLKAANKRKSDKMVVIRSAKKTKSVQSNETTN